MFKVFFSLPLCFFFLFGCSTSQANSVKEENSISLHSVNIQKNAKSNEKAVSPKTEATSSSAEKNNIVLPAQKILNAPLISQMPELPRGCEVTSLTMMLRYAGVKADKMVLASQVLKVPYYSNGLYGNPYDGFVGNMYTFSKPGLGVYHGPIVKLANQYLKNRIVDLTGKSFDTVIQSIANGKPVWVVSTSTFNIVPSKYWVTWKTKSGTVRVTRKEHSVLVTGYDSQYIYFNDPLANIKNRKILKSNFLAGWKQIGSQAITYR